MSSSACWQPWVPIAAAALQSFLLSACVDPETNKTSRPTIAAGKQISWCLQDILMLLLLNNRPSFGCFIIGIQMQEWV